ncbi:hypothetical protein D3C75_881750 [compost metagenome]
MGRPMEAQKDDGLVRYRQCGFGCVCSAGIAAWYMEVRLFSNADLINFVAILSAIKYEII